MNLSMLDIDNFYPLIIDILILTIDLKLFTNVIEYSTFARGIEAESPVRILCVGLVPDL